ncbi:hypothetical protein [Streptomyces sp. NPDC051561]|uniref:hypothetical protein n=1 Tax=Streptomyces sp. NPDC051561 TaxID=3365658 RepID=UPI00378B2585
MSQRNRGRRLRGALAGTAALCVVVGLPGQALAAGGPGSYVFDTEAEATRGAATTADAPALKAGATYKDSIEPKGKQYYRLDLDAKTNAYVSAVAVPKAGTKVKYGDDLKVSVLDRNNSSCDSGDSVSFGSSAEFPRPLSTYAARLLKEGSSSCQKAGAYYVLVERGSSATSTPEDWELEIRYQSEPGLKAAGPTEAPESWPSASPAPPTGGPQPRKGGTGFNDATGLTSGEWRDEIKPGQSLFYRVPVDWGQQIFSDVDLHSTDGGKNAYVGGALDFALYNPARGLVQDESGTYDGKQKSTSMDPLRPVAYENRFDSGSGDKDMQLAGWYYLRVSMNPKVGQAFGEKPYGLTLRVNVTGQKQAGPDYAAPSTDFGVTEDDREAASSGQSGSAAEQSSTMKTVAAAGIGAGTVLVLGLAVWMLVARRKASAEPPVPPQQSQQGFGPPTGW